MPKHVSITRRIKSDKLILSFQFYTEYQTGSDILVCIFVPTIRLWRNNAKLLYQQEECIFVSHNARI